MSEIEINRGTYDIYNAFGQIRNFPIYDDANPKMAVLVRLFTMADYAPISHKFVYMAIWSMRSHVLNSDMSKFKPTVIFHIESDLFETARPIFEGAGIPSQNIIVYPSDMFDTPLEGVALHKAASPFVDPQLEQFDRVIVLDADSFSLGNTKTGVVPLMDVSLNKLRPDTISLLRGWTKWEPERDEYKNWYDHGGVGKEGWIERAANYCNCRPETIERLMYPTSPATTPRPFHNGAYINIPMGALKHNPEFRQFIYEVSCQMGNEEIAMAIWAMKHYLETGRHFPDDNLQDYIFEYADFQLYWSLDSGWRELQQNGVASLVHLYGFNDISDYVYEWAQSMHASDDEVQVFGDTVIRDIKQIKEGDST